MRSVYNADTGWRVYPDGNNIRGPEITESTVFDEVQITCLPEGFVIGEAVLLNSGTWVTNVAGLRVQGSLVPTQRMRYDRDDPEIMIVKSRIRTGSCRVTFKTLENWRGPSIITSEELHEANFLMDLLHPFHVDDKDLFFDHLTRHLEHVEPDGDNPPHFTFPGIVEGNQRRYYKRHETSEAPDVTAYSDLAGAGWTPDIPWGAHALSAIDVLDAPKTFAVSAPTRVYHRRKDQDGAITAMARAWRNYWNALDSSYQNNPVRRTMRDHVEHAIGRMWADRPNDGSISIFYDGQRTGRTRDARDVEDWMLGNMEQWVHEWGFPAMALALNNGSNRTLLESQLGDYTFCHLKEDGSVGDRLNNGGDGITQATWDAYQDTHYQAALGTIITAEAGPDAIVQSGGNYAMQGSASILNPSGTTVYAWELASGEGGSLDDAAVAAPSFTAPILAAGADPVVLVYRLTVTNNNASDSDQVTLQVASAVLLPGLASIPVTAGGTREHQLTHTGGIAPYTYAKVSGPAWISIDGTTGVVTATPPADTAVGDHASGYEVTDASGAVVASIISFAVQSA